jgi:hypothetical protein
LSEHTRDASHELNARCLQSKPSGKPAGPSLAEGSRSRKEVGEPVGAHARCISRTERLRSSEQAVVETGRAESGGGLSIAEEVGELVGVRMWRIYSRIMLSLS